MHGPQEHTDTEGGPHTATRAILTDVQGTKFHNWDGQSMAGDNVVTLPPSVGTLLEQEVMPALVALLQSQPNGGTAWDFECQIEDMQSDSDEYCTSPLSVTVCPLLRLWSPPVWTKQYAKLRPSFVDSASGLTATCF
eukprot:m.230540 g.230540  ORF g.230540 m.230540 type:complete len:137 (-) comp19262_c0_seq9:776-1186(-)